MPRPNRREETKWSWRNTRVFAEESWHEGWSRGIWACGLSGSYVRMIYRVSEALEPLST